MDSVVRNTFGFNRVMDRVADQARVLFGFTDTLGQNFNDDHHTVLLRCGILYIGSSYLFNIIIFKYKT